MIDLPAQNANSHRTTIDLPRDHFLSQAGGWGWDFCPGQDARPARCKMCSELVRICSRARRTTCPGPKVFGLVRIGSDLFGFVSFWFRIGRKRGAGFVRVANFEKVVLGFVELGFGGCGLFWRWRSWRSLDF